MFFFCFFYNIFYNKNIIQYLILLAFNSIYLKLVNYILSTPIKIAVVPIQRKSNEYVKSSNELSKEQIEQIGSIFGRMLKEHENNISKIIAANTKMVSDKIEAFSKQIEEIKESMEFTEKELRKDITMVKNNNENEIIILKNKLRDLEDRSRRNNLRIDGIAESENESWNDCAEKVKGLFKNNLNLKDEIIIERAHSSSISKQQRTTTNNDNQIIKL